MERMRKLEPNEVDSTVANNPTAGKLGWQSGAAVGVEGRRTVLKVGPCTPSELVEFLQKLLKVEEALQDNSDTTDGANAKSVPKTKTKDISEPTENLKDSDSKRVLPKGLANMKKKYRRKH